VEGSRSRSQAEGEIRLDSQAFIFGCRDRDRNYAEAIFREGLVDIRQFEGEEERGQTAQAPVRIRFDSGTGRCSSRWRQRS
jgi:hypothetical protein